MSLAQKKMFLRTSMRSLYDLQKLRIQMGNRIVGNFKAKLGLKPSKKENTLDKKGKEILDDLRKSFRKITDGIKKYPKKEDFVSDGVISDYGELNLVANYMELEKQEKSGFARLEKDLEEFPVWVKYLSGIDGIGPQMGAVIIGEINIHDFWECGEGPAKRRCLPEDAGAQKKICKVSTLWKYAGLAVEPDGLGQSKKEQHLVDREYTDKKGKLALKKSITFNPFLKTKLCGVLGPSFLRMGISWEPCDEETYNAAPPYKRAIKDKKIDGVKKEVKCVLVITHPLAKVYFDYRWRLENHPKYKDETVEEKNTPEPDLEADLEESDTEDDHADVPSAKNKGKKGHRHRMALRYAVKVFLLQLHAKWRELEGYPPTPPYAEAKLGLKH